MQNLKKKNNSPQKKTREIYIWAQVVITVTSILAPFTF